jgi:APA family basic amino acid/polyamine antiporter
MPLTDKPATRPTLGLGGLTTNAMALIAPGAFLWLAYFIQASYGAPMAAQAMWFGILAAFLLCLATAIAYSELSKLYPGLASSYFFAEQAFLRQNKAFRFARIAKFVVGWASHLYYWVYPGLMCGAAALIAGYAAGQIWPGTFNAAVPSPLFMIIFCPLFAFAVAYMCRRGVTGTTAINAAINVIQISALVVFSIVAVAYRLNHAQGTAGITLDRSSAPISRVVAQGGIQDFTVDYSKPSRLVTEGNDPNRQVEKFEYHSSALSVIAPHRFSFAVLQACISILILVGFESVTWMGEEATQPKRDIPRAVILSLLIQGLVCYLIEYFAANFFLHNGYSMSNAVNSAAPIADMMIIAGTWLFGSASAGKAFMLVQMLTVFLALVGTTLASMNIAARVSYVMDRDREAAGQSRILHAGRATPHRIIWILAVISSFIAIASVIFVFCGPAALEEDVIKALPQNMWYNFGIFGHDLASRIPQSLVVVALVSNFGTFLLYMMTCVLAIVAFREHHTFNGFKHVVIPMFGVLANLLCMSFYVIGPFMVDGISAKEPFIALAICGLWGLCGWIYFKRAIKKPVPPAKPH